jgi:hypothetical protein
LLLAVAAAVELQAALAVARVAVAELLKETSQ